MGNSSQYYKAKKHHQYICSLSQQSDQNECLENSQNYHMNSEHVERCLKDSKGSFKISQKKFLKMNKIFISQKSSPLKDKIWLDLEQEQFKKQFRLQRNQIIRLNNLAIKVKAIIGIKEFQRFEYLKKKNLINQGEFPNNGLQYIVQKQDLNVIQPQNIYNFDSCVTISTSVSNLQQENYNKKCRICFEDI